MAVLIERTSTSDGKTTNNMAILPSGKILVAEGYGDKKKEMEETIEHFGSVEAAMPVLEHMYGGVAVYGTDLYVIEDPQEARQIIQEAGLKEAGQKEVGSCADIAKMLEEEGLK